MNIPFYQFSFINVMITMVLSIISCMIGIESSRYIKRNKGRKKDICFCSLLLGSTFWLTHLFISLSVHLPFSTGNHVLYFIGNLLLSSVASYFALLMAQRKFANQFQYLLSGVFIGLAILGADVFGFATLFKEILFIKPILLTLSSLLSIGTAFSSLRFLTQLTDEDTNQILNRWRISGYILAGLSLGGIPYISLVSIVDYARLSPTSSGLYSFLVPFIFMVMANLFLMLGSDLFGDIILLKSIHRYQSLFKYNPNAILSLDLDGTIQDMNHNLLKITGYDSRELMGCHFDILFDRRKRVELHETFTSIKQGNAFTIETEMIRKDGSICEILITGAPILSDKILIGIYTIMEDITIKKWNENTIKHLAFHDMLTNLPNKRAFVDKMVELSHQTSFALVFLDFDKFKRINDTLGHSFGDQVLNTIAMKLQSLQERREIYLISRLGGDEFALLVPANEGEPIAIEILKEFEAVLEMEHELTIAPSIGISLFPQHSENIDDLLKYADLAMYQAKRGKMGYKFFEKKMTHHLMEDFKLENELRKALINEELMVYFQPKFNIVTQEYIGGEALLRWNHPEQGFIPPNIFIPLAEETGLINQIEVFVLTQVVKYLEQWKKKNFTIGRISVNISQFTLTQKGFFSFIQSLLSAYEVDGSCLELEITERMLMENEQDVNHKLKKLKELGIEISIDDFGTGYSSLSYLQYLSIDRLKIDKSFVQESEENIGIISAIISMAKSLNLKLIAEGVETNKQIGLLQELGCFEVQGYYYSPAVSKEDYEEYLSTSNSKIEVLTT